MRSLHSRIALLAAAAAFAVPATAAAQAPPRTLSVVGDGQTELTPDRGSFSASVQRRAKSADAARARVSRRARAIVAGIRAVGVARPQITTETVSVRRVRRRVKKNGPVRVHYRAYAGLSVRVDGIKRLSRALGVATRRGATDVYGPWFSFTATRRSLGLQRAEAAALADARRRADVAATAQGLRIVGIQSIDLDPAQNGYPDALSSSGDGGGTGDEATATPILPGRETVTSQARVVFLIEPTG